MQPDQVCLLRHSGTGRLGLTAFDLWKKQDGSFEQYQGTQAADRPLFNRRYWAGFVASPEGKTVFVGLYSAKLGNRAKADLACPLNGIHSDERKARLYNFFELKLLEELRPYRGILEIEWDRGYVSWARYAERSTHAILQGADAQPFIEYEASPEGHRTWHENRQIERDPKLSKVVLEQNHKKHFGQYVCESCGFKHSDRSMFDVHHREPLLTGPRLTRIADLIVLCPLCHRRAHRSGNRLQPYSLAELKQWNAAGQP